MTWTYSPFDLSTSSKDQVRIAIGDILSTDPQLQDEEIASFIAGRTSISGACADCCRAIASRMSRSVTMKTTSAGANWSDLSKAYLRMAIQFDQQAISSGSAMPYAGGISIVDKMNQESNTDRVQPQFNLDMDDNRLMPFGPAGGETEESGQPEGPNAG